MDDSRFDALARSLTSSTTRRSTLRLLAGGALAGALGLRGADEAGARCRRLGAKCARGDRCCGGARCAGRPRQCTCTGDTKPCDGKCIPTTDCCPGETRACYSGPTGTENVGICRAGTQTCGPDRTWGGCTGEVTPRAETCNGQDDDCNGQVDNGPNPLNCTRGRMCLNGNCVCDPHKFYCGPDCPCPSLSSCLWSSSSQVGWCL